MNMAVYETWKHGLVFIAKLLECCTLHGDPLQWPPLPSMSQAALMSLKPSSRCGMSSSRGSYLSRGFSFGLAYRPRIEPKYYGINVHHQTRLSRANSQI